MTRVTEVELSPRVRHPFGRRDLESMSERDHRVEGYPGAALRHMRRLALISMGLLALAGCSDKADRAPASRDQVPAPSPELPRVDTGISHPADSAAEPATTPAEESPPP